MFRKKYFDIPLHKFYNVRTLDVSNAFIRNEHMIASAIVPQEFIASTVFPKTCMPAISPSQQLRMHLELYEGRMDAANNTTDAQDRKKFEDDALQTLRDIEAHCKKYQLNFAEALAATGQQ